MELAASMNVHRLPKCTPSSPDCSRLFPLTLDYTWPAHPNPHWVPVRKLLQKRILAPLEGSFKICNEHPSNFCMGAPSWGVKLRVGNFDAVSVN